MKKVLLIAKKESFVHLAVSQDYWEVQDINTPGLPKEESLGWSTLFKFIWFH